MKTLCDFCENIKMTVVAGFFLVISLLLMLNGVHIAWDPAWITVAICGYPLIYSAVHGLFIRRQITSALLISTAMIAAIAIDEIFAAGEIAFIMAIGEFLEEKTLARAKKGISALMKLAPQTGRRLITVDGKEEIREIPAEEIEKGFILRCLPGEKIPVDGIIISGKTSVDQSVMTGESLPVDKSPGDAVFCGTINCFGSVDIKAAQAGKNSSLQKMIALVREAENKKAPTARIVDKWASRLVPIALFIAIITFFITGDISRAVTVLVVFCPCALALATPTSIMAAIGQATRRGILIKSGEALEKMGEVNCIAFDKTGTLTQGKLAICDVIPANESVSGDILLKYTAVLENQSEHPIGKAVVQHVADKGFDLSGVSNLSAAPGRGISGMLNGRKLLCGNLSFMNENNIVVSSFLQKKISELHQQGKALIITAYNGNCLGVLALSDVIRQATADVIKELKNLNTEVFLLTGDHDLAARHFACTAGITKDKIKSELLPEGKVAEIIRLQKSGKIVCMIGDGVNDAPSIKSADVGVAMASMGSDIAIEAADIALLGDDIENIPYLKRLSRAAVFSIKFNISLSMAINFIAIILSVTGILTPVWGALVHNAGSVLVVLNAAFLYDRKI